MPKQVSALGVRWSLLGDGRLMLRYRVDGCASLTVPEPVIPGRADGLWKQTCFELFLHDGGGRYREFNFSPSGQWAAYRFSGYRTDGEDYDPVMTPEVTMDCGPAVFTLTAFLAASELESAQAAALSAVLIEERRRPSYWALKHGGLKPDFHDPACFCIRLAPADAS